MARFIVIEGLSGTGKTTIAKALAERIDGLYMKPPIPPLSEIREKVDESFSNEARALFYLSGIVEMSHRIKKIITKKNVVLDKYIYTTLTYPKSKGIQITVPPWVSILEPYLSVQLILDEKTRLNRLKERGSNFAINKQLDPARVREIINGYSSHNLIQVSNGGTVSETIGRILSLLDNGEKG